MKHEQKLSDLNLIVGNFTAAFLLYLFYQNNCERDIKNSPHSVATELYFDQQLLCSISNIYVTNLK
jgi:hypothetical protein